MSESVEIVYVRDLSSGRIHKRTRIGGSSSLTSYEADNADDAGDYEVLDTLSADSDAEAFCKRCFPEDDDGVQL